MGSAGVLAAVKAVVAVDEPRADEPNTVASAIWAGDDDIGGGKVAVAIPLLFDECDEGHHLFRPVMRP